MTHVSTVSTHFKKKKVFRTSLEINFTNALKLWNTFKFNILSELSDCKYGYSTKKVTGGGKQYAIDEMGEIRANCSS